MEKFKITPYQSQHADRWNAFNTAARNGSFLFDRGFMDYHSDRFSDFSLMVTRDQEIVAILPANLEDDVVISHSGLTYGSLVYHDLRLEDVIGVFQMLLHYLESRAISLFRIKTIPVIYHKYPAQDLDYVLFLAGASLIRRDTLAVCEPRKQIGFSSMRKRGYRKAVGSGLTILEDKNFEGFWNQILIPNLNTKHQVHPVHSLNEIEMLSSRFPENIRQFNVYEGEDIIAGTTIFESSHVAHAQYISTFGGEKKGALDFLFSYLIEHVFADKAYFDFGISNEENGLKLNAGLSNWKQGFGAGIVVHDFYEVPTHHHDRLQHVII